MDAGDGDDLLEGGRGTDVLRGGRGRDRLNGGLDADRIAAGPGNDIVVAMGGGSTRSTAARATTRLRRLDRPRARLRDHRAQPVAGLRR
jgi:hypothetical protein